ncbi:UV DNA damage repair endonuclease UvsE [Candidatus Dependentiae bacterium]|nr:UV DNA damage repair endonuclease UvsE [Candidatus Dependentiae bacterium]
MKTGYPCINTGIGCTPNTTFRLASYCSDRLIGSITENIACLKKILDYNVKNNLLFFRIGSSVIPFASHDVCQFDWLEFFTPQFKELGRYIKKHNIRISMHPDQFIVLNSPKADVVARSIRELEYHAQFLDALELDTTAKIQLHVGGAYGDKKQATKRFVETYKQLDSSVKRRLVIENDDRIYSAQDCLALYQETGVPLLFDTLHQEVLNNGENLLEIMTKLFATWSINDGIPMIDYSTQDPQGRRGKHAISLDKEHFAQFIETTRDLDFDIMLELKDKEKNALQALKILQCLRPLNKSA